MPQHLHLVFDPCELARVVGGQRLSVNDGPASTAPASYQPPSPFQFHLPPPTFAGPPRKTKCPPWRAQLGQSNIGILIDGTPTVVPTLFCEKYRSPLSK